MAKISVIDDSLSVCFAIERMLRARGMEVVSHRSGEAALQGLEQETPDLVLCDLVLPDIEGFQICTFIKTHPKLSSVPVIVISGIVDEEVRAQAEDVGAIAVLKKPFASEAMLNLVERILRERGVLEDGKDEAVHEPSTPQAGESSIETAAVVVEPEAATASKPPRILLSNPSPQPAPEKPVQEKPADELLDRLEAQLEPLASIEALRFACILSPGGELRGYGPAKPTATDLAALPELMRAATNTATHSGHGEVGILSLETTNGVLVIKPQEEGNLLVLGLGDLAVLGKARYLLRRL